ncbi:hypothetical protein NL108_003839 [Boleophthalmus pectinirostris]|uniref:homeobox and leucine zipper encoding b n=1 Tax=Boleophthalmus pectinirostris TaxID=150288 RepID=UPI00242F04F6|nr:homeobox and leucine zipper encoding b [Boleophthalmus pectinirostris]XP_055012632.1 homeobox and leucine zipper encoding b [Boleophthalmus pectinirostris]KAJ0055469.1 hypothetical protein NL108_003839 [Boleophthalmus pectinirostris]
MRQKINEHVPFTTGTTLQKAVSKPTLAPAAFNTNQNSTLCLPLMNENNKIIWVLSDQINIQGDKVAKLDEAFSTFPYLTQKKTISLAHSCSLHPDQVKVWFMAQRLRYGISWSSKDIHELRRKMPGGIMSKKKLPKCENETTKKLSREDEELASHSCEIKKEILTSAAIEDQMNTEEKPRERKRKKILKKEDVHLNTIKTSQIWWPETGTDFTSLQQTDENSFVILDKTLDTTPSVTFQTQVASSHTSLAMEQEQIHMKTNPQHSKEEMFIKEPPVCSNIDGSVVKEQSWIGKRSFSGRIKTSKQLAFMKMEFTKYQYPTNEQYKAMAELTGVPREGLVQWFTDMRYSIKKTKPTWLSVEQHKRVVANVIHAQCIRKMKMQKTSEQRRCKEVY